MSADDLEIEERLAAQRQAVKLAKRVRAHLAVIKHHASEAEALYAQIHTLPLSDAAREVLENVIDGQDIALLRNLESEAEG